MNPLEGRAMVESNSRESAYRAALPGMDKPAKIGRYTILKELGQGSSGVVFLAKDPYIDRLVAIKVSSPSPEVLKKGAQHYNHAFFREARSSGRLSHPNIVAIYDADVYEEHCYIGMEYIDGPTLKGYCTPGNLLPPARAAEIVLNICKALDYAHNRGVVHRDVKPSNILLTKAGAAKISDFSIARMLHETLILDAKKRKSILGTIHYMSPEHLISQDSVDSRSDIFSLGSVLFELFTGARAFQSDNDITTMFKIANEDAPSITAIRPDLPETMDRVIKKALSKKASERYQSCMEFAYDLSVALRHLRTSRKETGESVLDYVSSIPFFEGFDKEEVKEILSSSTILKMKKGQTIVNEGEVDDSLYIILSGSVEVFKNDTRIDVIERGECFGEMAYLSGQPRAASIRASTNCILMKISGTLMDKAPEAVQRHFLKSFAMTLVGRISKNQKLILSLMKGRRDTVRMKP